MNQTIFFLQRACVEKGREFFLPFPLPIFMRVCTIKNVVWFMTLEET